MSKEFTHRLYSNSKKNQISLRYITFQINAFPRLVTPAVWWLSIRLVHSNGCWPREILTNMDICIFLWKRVRVKEPQVLLIFWPNDLILCKNVFPFSSLPWDVLVGVVKIFASNFCSYSRNFWEFFSSRRRQPPSAQVFSPYMSTAQ